MKYSLGALGTGIVAGILAALLCLPASSEVDAIEITNMRIARTPTSDKASDGISPRGLQASEEPPVELLRRVAHSMGRYARDVSEIPLRVESTVSKFDSSGKQTRSKSSSHSLQFVKRSYAQGMVRRHLRADKPGLHRVSEDEMSADSATSLLALAFDNGAPGPFQYELITHVISKRLEVKFADSSPCVGFDPTAHKDERPWCGEAHLFVDSANLDPLNASFEAGGFPRTFNGIRYLSFKFVEEFQKVSIKGSKQPFLLPAKIVLTYESDQERTVVESKYSVRD